MTDRTVLKCLYDQNLMGRKSSVHGNNEYRLNRAKEQLEFHKELLKKPNTEKSYKDLIIEHANDFLKKLGMPQVQNPIYKLNEKPIDRDFYKDIKEKYNLVSVNDIVWMKFTQEGVLGVVGVSNDINFDIPNSTDYDSLDSKGYWRFNTSGIIVHSVGQQWDEEFVLVFPLKSIPEGYVRGDIECGIGNYLIENDIPILDYYSHKF